MYQWSQMFQGDWLNCSFSKRKGGTNPCGNASGTKRETQRRAQSTNVWSSKFRLPSYCSTLAITLFSIECNINAGPSTMSQPLDSSSIIAACHSHNSVILCWLLWNFVVVSPFLFVAFVYFSLWFFSFCSFFLIQFENNHYAYICFWLLKIIHNSAPIRLLI